jgi:hypothetical protein
VRHLPPGRKRNAGGEIDGTVEAALEGCDLVQVLLGWPEGVALEADEAVEAPEREGDAVYEDELEVAEGVEGGDEAGEVGFPV